MTFEDWLNELIMLADKREFNIDRYTDGRRLKECFDRGFDPEDTLDGFIQDACDGASLYARAPW